MKKKAKYRAQERIEYISLFYRVCVVQVCVIVYVCRTDTDRNWRLNWGHQFKWNCYTHSKYTTTLSLSFCSLLSTLLRIAPLNPIEASDKRTQINFAIQHTVLSLLQCDYTHTSGEPVKESKTNTHTHRTRHAHSRHAYIHKHRLFKCSTEWVHLEYLLRSFTNGLIRLNKNNQFSILLHKIFVKKKNLKKMYAKKIVSTKNIFFLFLFTKRYTHHCTQMSKYIKRIHSTFIY